MGITRSETLDCFASDDLIGLGMEADAIRRQLHPEGVVSYLIDGRIDVSSAPGEQSFEHTAAKIEGVLSHGGTGIILRGDATVNGVSGQDFEVLESLLHKIKSRFSSLWLHGLSASEILTLSAQSDLTVDETLHRLHDAGLDSLAGDDAGILDDAVLPPAARGSCKAADWIAVHRTAHSLGLQSTATMIFGAGETAEHRLNHLELLHQLQQDTRGFASFTPWTYTPRTASAPGFEEATAVEYLKTLAISRMLLDNVTNIQSSLETQGLKVLQVTLRFGANDVGSVPPSTAQNAATEEQLRQVIRGAGFMPVQRDTLYRTMYLP